MRRRNRLLVTNTVKGYAFLLPNIFGFVLFVGTPVVASLALSFTNWDGFKQMDFVGFENYRAMFSNSTFQIASINTLVYTLFSVPFTLAISILLSVLLNSGIAGQKFARTALFIPYIAPSVAVAVVWQLLFHPSMGPINTALIQMGVASPPRWLSSPDWALPSVIIVSVWKRVGYFMVIFLAGLQGIPDQLYESADIDGANKARQFFAITLPMLSPTIFFASIIGIIQSFKVFDLIYALTEGGPGRSTNVLAYTIYQEAFMKYKFGYASAISYILFATILVVTVIQFRGQKKWVHY